MKNAWGGEGHFHCDTFKNAIKNTWLVCVQLCMPLFNSSKHCHKTHTQIRFAPKLHQTITINCHLSQLKRRGCIFDQDECRKVADRLWQLRGAPGVSGASLCPESSLHCGGRSSQGLLLIWHPFSSLSHLQVGAHTAKGLLTISASFLSPSSLLSPSHFFVLIPHPSIYRSARRCLPPHLFTISRFHFLFLFFRGN